MCYRLLLHHKKCGHESILTVYCPRAPRYPITDKPIGKLCYASSRTKGRVFYKKDRLLTNARCRREECEHYERLRRYWRCCCCGNGPNKDPFCKMTVPRQSVQSLGQQDLSVGRSRSLSRGRGRSRSLSPCSTLRAPLPEQIGNDGRGVDRNGTRDGGNEGEEKEEAGEDDRDSRRRRSVSTYRRTCGHQPCQKCTWFGTTIPTYNRRTGSWTRVDDGSGSDSVDAPSSQTLPDVEDEAEELPDEMMTDTEFNADLYDSGTEDYEDDDDDYNDEEEQESHSDQAPNAMNVVASAEPMPDLGNIYDADTEAEDDDGDDEADSSSEDEIEDEMETDAEHDIDDDCPESETDSEFGARVRRAQRGVNSMSLVATEEDTDMDSDATITDPEMDFDSDDEQTTISVDDGSENRSRGSNFEKHQQSTRTTEDQRGAEAVQTGREMAEGGPVLSLGGFQRSPERFLPKSDGS